MTKRTGLDGRARDENGQIRAKNGNTRIDTLRETYGEEFALEIRGDAHPSTLLERSGDASLSAYLRNQKN